MSVDKENNLWVGLLVMVPVDFRMIHFHPWKMPLLKGRSVTSVLKTGRRLLVLNPGERSLLHT